MMSKHRTPLIILTVLALAIVTLLVISRDMTAPRQVDIQRMNQIEQAIESYVAANGKAPESLADLALSPEVLLDHSGHPIQYTTIGSTVRLTSYGGDQLPGGKAFKSDYEQTFEIDLEVGQ